MMLPATAPAIGAAGRHTKGHRYGLVLLAPVLPFVAAA